MENITTSTTNNFTDLEHLFHSNSTGNAILFLGAGASVTEKRYLSKDIILLYEENINKNLGVTDLVEFVDILSADEKFDRIEFDTFVYKLLEKLKFNDIHKTIVSQPWRKIITTNQDLLLEQAYDSIRGSADQVYELRYIRNPQEYYQTHAANEIQYIKLNGCISERKSYPLIYSSEDFAWANNFYKLVLNELKSVSDKIKFISIGYSFDDPFSKLLLDKFDKYDFRARRTFYTIDPFVNDSHLEYLKKNRISVIKSTAEEFFNQFRTWEEENADTILRNKKITFYNSDNSRLNLPAKLSVKLSAALDQLNNKHKYAPTDKLEFYKGAEPTYGTILKGHDVIRETLIKRLLDDVMLFINNNDSYSIPIVFLKGEYGAGKSTVAYRLLYDLYKSYPKTIVFEVTDHTKLSVFDLIELFNTAKAEYYVFFFNYVERNSVFNALLEFRNSISSLQIESHKVFLLASIRENILERFKYNKTIKNCSEFDIPSKLNDVEILSLLENLKEIGFVSFRDQKEKKKLLNGIKTKYESDAFITLLELVPGRHYLDLMEAVNNLPPTAKEAVIYISALHQFNILMPVGLLRVLISKDWDIFRNEFLSIDCKKIVIEVEDELYSSNSDLYFKIKHPIIAKNIIERFISNKDDLYKLYFKLLSNVFNSVVNSRVVNDLLKLLRYNDYFNLEKLNKLYDVTYSQMSEDPYFLLYYSINLQRRNTFEDLKKAITLILYAESFFQRKNHRFIHRRAVLNFQIAKMLYEVFEKTELIETYEYLTESEELFKIKLLLDPCSSYSFCEYIEFLFWKIDNLNLSSEEDLRNRIRIEELVDLAERTVFDNIDRVLILKQQYISKYQGTMKKDDYLKKLLGFYEDESFRPLALILLYNLYEQMGQNDKLDETINELEYFSANDEVSKFLFKYYGRNLNYTQSRIKFYDLIHNHPLLEDTQSLRFNFFMFIADCYNQYIHKAYTYLDSIKYKYHNLNPDYKFVWKEADSDVEMIFDGIAILNKRNYLKIQIPSLQQSFYTEKKLSIHPKAGQKVKLKLNFYLYGIRAEIISIEDELKS